MLTKLPPLKTLPRPRIVEEQIPNIQDNDDIEESVNPSDSVIVNEVAYIGGFV